MSQITDGEGARRPPPHPGSRAALELGCRCPVVDNAHGRGTYRDADGVWQFWIYQECPLHGAVGVGNEENA